MGLGSTVIWALAVGYGIVQAESATSIAVLVYNDAKTPGANLEEAEAFAARSYRAAGIALTWVECTESQDDIQRFRACEQANAGHPLILKIISERMATAFPRFRESDGALGMAASSYAFVVYARTQKSAAVWGVPEHMVLGRTIAHELGHLLLGENSHSRNGLMQPRFGPRDLALESGQFLFDPKQAAYLRKLSWWRP